MIRANNAAGATDILWLWGQFIDHDLDITEAADPEEAFAIPVPAGDPFFDPGATGTAEIPLSRSTYDPATGTGASNPRQQINGITAFIDASNVYGSDLVRATALRENDGTGRLKKGRRRLLPFNETGLPNAGGPGPELFLAGDVRANEHVALSALHTVFVLEHNKLLRSIRREHRGIGGDELYERARAMVGAELQVITYKEFLPVLLGPNALSSYAGYNPNVNPGISNVFANAAYRLGHSMLSAELLSLRRNGRPVGKGPPLALRDTFFSPHLLIRGVRPQNLFRGLAEQWAQDVDLLVIDDVRNFLFGPPGAGGFDLPALNIQRGRDHGLADYNQVRSAFGLVPAASFADITADTNRQQQLASVYASVNDVDVWVGGLAEDHVPGALVGELFFTVIKDQFERVRDGDRFWYQNVFTGNALAELEATTLADVFRRNAGVGKHIRDNVFVRQ
jgi:hypothetical protein